MAKLDGGCFWLFHDVHDVPVFVEHAKGAWVPFPPGRHRGGWASSRNLETWSASSTVVMLSEK